MVLLLGFKSQLSQVPAAQPQHPKATHVMGWGRGGAVNNATLSHRMKCMKRGEQSVPQVLTAYFIFIPFYVPRYTPGPVSCFVVFLTSMYLLFYLRYNQSVP